MLRGQTPRAWRQGFRLFHRRARTDAYGESVPYYDMEQPDLTVEDGSEEGLCFQSVRAWQSAGRVSSGVDLQENGEQIGGSAQAVLYGPMEVQMFDHILIGDGCFEVRGIQQWMSYRLLLMDRIE